MGRSRRNTSSVRAADDANTATSTSAFSERPAIDRLLDFLSHQESRKPAIDILIQEYLERIDSPSTYYRETMGPISPLMDISTIDPGSFRIDSLV